MVLNRQTCFVNMTIVTHVVGASSSSMSPLMKMAISCEEALISSSDFDTFNLFMSSSSTFMDWRLAFLIWVWVGSETSAGAMMGGKGSDIVGGIW